MICFDHLYLRISRGTATTPARSLKAAALEVLTELGAPVNRNRNLKFPPNVQPYDIEAFAWAPNLHLNVLYMISTSAGKRARAHTLFSVEILSAIQGDYAIDV